MSRSTQNSQLLHAELLGAGEYTVDVVDGDLEHHLWGMEYGDVAAGIYQIWEYPSGKIQDVEPDRYGLEDDDYSTPHADVWVPVLTNTRYDKKLISEEFEKLQALPERQLWSKRLRQLLSRIFRK